MYECLDKQGACLIFFCLFLLNNKLVKIEWQAITSGEHDLNNYTTEGRYYFSGSASLINSPSNKQHGYLEVLPSITSSNRFKQIWHSYGQNDTGATSGQADYTDEYIRSYYAPTPTDSVGWSDWCRFLISYNAEMPFIYKRITSPSSYSLSVPANGYVEFRMSSNSTMLSAYQVDKYAPFCLYSINWSGGSSNIYTQTYEISTANFWIYFANRSSSAVTLTNLTFGFMYYRQGLML